MSRKGFTLLEVLLVVVVLAVLAGIAFGLMSVVSSSRVRLTETRVHTIGCAIETHRKVKGTLPATLEDLRLELPMAGGRYVDAWERPLEYRVDGKEFRLWSCGLDERSGTADDISFKNK
jgi:general secretion pathway protein G